MELDNADWSVRRQVRLGVFCPHCNGKLLDHDDVRGGRCPSCRLVVGAGRTLTRPTDRTYGAGFAANAAKREKADPVEERTAFEALREVAAQVGCNVERMRMTDYDRVSREDPSLPSIAQILATFDTWKNARQAALRAHHPDTRGGTARPRR